MRHQENERHVQKLEALINKLANAEARREASEGEFVFHSSSVDEIMEFLNSNE